VDDQISEAGQLGHDDFATSMVGLSLLLTGHRTLPEMLTQIAHCAVQAIPGADGAGLTVLAGAWPQAMVASAAFVHAVDDLQYGLGEGPSVSAVDSGVTQWSGSLGDDARWPRFGPLAARLGVHSVLAAPLLLANRTVGAVHAYALAPDGFSPGAVLAAEGFAGPAAVSVHNARMTSSSEQMIDQLRDALSGREVVNQALGIIMSRTGLDPDGALEWLRALSDAQQRDVVMVASVLVQDAVGRSRR
jgi:GAF domain-containing protein